MRKIILSIPERLSLPSLLPRSGKIIEMEIVKSIAERVRFTPQEIEEYELKDVGENSVQWNFSKAKDREFRFEGSEIEVVKKGINALDEKGEILLEFLSVIKKFIGETKKGGPVK